MPEAKIDSRKPGLRSPLRGWLSGAACLLALGGCTVGPDYEQPEMALPMAYRGDAITSPLSIADLHWQEMFPDPLLVELIEEALDYNQDLRQALARVEQARAIARQARAGYFPSVGYQGTIGRGRNAALGQPSFTQGQTNTTVLGMVDASWELDLWGRVRRLNEAAQAQFLATEDAARSVSLMLICEVANNYYQLRSLDSRRAIAMQAVESYQESLDLFQFRYDGGVASLLEVYSAQGAVEQTKALKAQLELAIATQENLISLLAGRAPSPVERAGPLVEAVLPVAVPVGLPSQLLERRFDIRQAEQSLRAVTANIGVAEANFFPQINLTGLLGRVSSDLSGITAGSANAWSVAAGLAGPIYQGGRLRGQYQEALAVRDEAVAHYEQTVLQSLREVSDELVAREKLREARQAQERAVEAYRKAVELSQQRYSTGLSNYLEVLQAQQSLFPGEDQLAQTIYAEWAAMIRLYQALGGGWEE